MSKIRRLIPSLAALSVSLTGCGDDIAGNWEVTNADDEALPFETFYSLSATGGDYDGVYFGLSESASGSMMVSASGEVTLYYNFTYAYSYVSPDGNSQSYSEECTYTSTGTSLSSARRSFEIRIDAYSGVCVDQDGNREDLGDDLSSRLNLDCVLHPERDLLDCIERESGGYWSFERGGE